ncbi:MAG: hypothetical protein PQJ58_18210 [Spirochaetales bacterium]|nr:hypothetical protein [Spirochaetales bacterium]
MKGKILVVFASLLFLAVPVFAEVTVSGDFVFGFNTSDDVYEGVFDTGDLYFTGSAANGNAAVIFGLDFTNITNSMSGSPYLDADFISDVYMDLNLTGAMGLDSPVGVSMLFGRSSYGANNYLGDITGYSTYDIINAETATSGYVGLSLNVLDMVNIVYGLDPNLVDGVQNMYANVNGTFGVVTAEVYGTMVGDKVVNLDDGIYNAIGADFVAALDTFSFGAGVEYNFDSEGTRYGASARTGLIPSTDVGVAFMGYSDADVNPYGLGFDANYAVTEDFKVYGALLLKDLENLDADDMVGFEISASYDVASDVTAYAGYVTRGSGFNAVGDVKDDSFFMAVSASF